MRIKYFLNDLPDEFNIFNIKQISIDTEALGLQIKRDRLCVVQLMIEDTKDVYIVHFPENNEYHNAVNDTNDFRFNAQFTTALEFDEILELYNTSKLFN